MITPPENANEEKRSAVPSNFPNYPNPQGIVIADPKFHSPLYKLARMMLRRGKHGKKNGQNVHVSHKKAKKQAGFY